MAAIVFVATSGCRVKKRSGEHGPPPLRVFVLDCEALSLAVRGDRKMIAWLDLAAQGEADVVTSPMTLVEAYDGRTTEQRWDWVLSRLKVADAGKDEARRARRLLADAKLHGHKYAIDAVLAVTVTPGGRFTSASPGPPHQIARQRATAIGTTYVVGPRSKLRGPTVSSTWESEANECLAPLLGLPQLPVVTWPEPSDEPEPAGLHWKTRTLLDWCAGRPFAWLDDEITDNDRLWAEAHHPARTLLHRIDHRYGITDADFTALEAWLRKT